ncbi:hypothetical protein V2J09_003845 [Rumex salicifolius]
MAGRPEANRNTQIQQHKLAEFERANDLLVSLLKIEAKFLPFLSHQETRPWSTTTLHIAIVVIVIYFIAKEAVICSFISREIWKKFILLLGALADILILLIIFPPFGWLALLLWAIGFTILTAVLGFQNFVYGGDEADRAAGAPLPPWGLIFT